MEKDYKKGIDILTRADGLKKYKPFAVYKSKKLYIIKSYGVYLLDKKGYITRDSERDAIELLEEAIKRKERWDMNDKNRKIVSEETTYID